MRKFISTELHHMFKRNTKRHIDKAVKQQWKTRKQKLSYNNKTMTGCISKEPCQMDIIKNTNSKSNMHKDK